MLVAELSQAHNWNLKHPWGKLPFDPMLLFILENFFSHGVYYNWFLKIIAKCKTLPACGWFVCLFVLLLLIYQVLRKRASCHPKLSTTHLCPFAHSVLSPGMPSLLPRAISSIKSSPVMPDHMLDLLPDLLTTLTNYSVLTGIWLYYLFMHFLICMRLGSSTRL